MLMTFYVTTETVCTSPSTTINCDDNQLITNYSMNFAASHNLAMVSTLSWETVILLIMILSSELTHALTSAVPMHSLSALMKQWPDKLTLDGFVWRRSHWPISRPHAPAAINQSVVGVSPALFLFFFLPLAGVYNEAISSELRNNSVTYQLVRVYTILFYIYCAQFLGYHSLHLFFSFSSSKCFCLLILVLFPLFFSTEVVLIYFPCLVTTSASQIWSSPDGSTFPSCQQTAFSRSCLRYGQQGEDKEQSRPGTGHHHNGHHLTRCRCHGSSWRHVVWGEKCS